MKYIITSVVICMFILTSHAQEKYSKVRIDLKSQNIESIAALGIDVTEGTYLRGNYFETDLGASELAKITEAQISYSIVIDNVSEFYATRSANDQSQTINREVQDDWTVPQNWEYGSMGGYYTLSEVMDELDAMHTLYPELISEREPLSTTNLTHEGRMQYWVRISDNPNVNEPEPEVLYTGVHHAREPMSVQQTIFYMWYLLENYDSDDEIKQLVDNTEMYFIPVINVDGYEYNYQTNPSGGGMWRKNRRDNGSGIFGVDPNRNYGFMWGLDDTGSSPYPDDQTYRGPEAFSEPEIQNVRDFCELNDFKIALNYHSYSNLLLYPWGWSEDPSEHDELLHDFSVIMTQENNYVYGPGSTTIYPTNGGSDDWMYGEQTTKDVIFSYTPEVGSSSDGFWPTVSRIIPLCQEQMWQNISAARLVGKYAVVTDMAPIVISDIVGDLPFNIKRLGLTDADLYTVSILPLDGYITSVGDPVSFENLELMEIMVDSIEYTLDGNIEAGTVFKYLLSVDNGDFIVSDTIEKVFGHLITIFEDGCDDMENWSSNKWNNSTDFYSTPASITDSPNNNYGDNEYNIITLDSTIDFTDVTVAYAQFWSKWEIESGYDYVQFMAKDVNSGGWVALEGKYTRLGTQNQQEGDPVYDGFYSEWNLEEVSLDEFIGKEVQFRFILVSDSYVTEDGFYFDDFNISVVSDITSIPSNSTNKSELFLAKPFPNPSQKLVNIEYELGNNEQQAVLEVINIMGNVVITQNVNNSNHVAIVDISNLSNGIYFYRLSTNTSMSEVRRFIKK